METDKLRIHVGSITEKGLEIKASVEAARLPLLKALSREKEVSFSRPVTVHLQATLAGDTVSIAGRVGSRVRIACSRCLTIFDLEIENDFSLTAVPQVQAPAEAGDEIELTVEEIEAVVYHGDAIDLGDEVAQQIIMALPFNPCCRDGCKGLCDHCGADLNTTTCDCDSRAVDNPFAVLEGLSFPGSKE